MTVWLPPPAFGESVILENSTTCRRLNGGGERVIQKGAYARDALLREVGRFLAACVGRRRADPDTERTR